MEHDQFLGKLLGQHESFSPDPFTQNMSSGNELIEPTGIVAINVPDGQYVHKGYVLESGKLSLAHALSHHAVLILTTDYSFIHIDKGKQAVFSKDGDKKRLGRVDTTTSSQFLEKDQPLLLTVVRYPQRSTYSPPATIKDVIIYRPHAPRTRRTSQSAPQSNLYTPLLRQFLR